MSQMTDPQSFIDQFLIPDEQDLPISDAPTSQKVPQNGAPTSQNVPPDELSVEAFQQRAQSLLEDTDPITNFIRSTQASGSQLFGRIAGILSPQAVSQFQQNLRDEVGDFDPNTVSGFLGTVSGQVIPAVAATLLFRKAGPTIAGIGFGMSAVGGKRAEIFERRQAGQEISGLREWTVALSTGFAEAAGEFVGLKAAQKAAGAIAPLVKTQLTNALGAGSQSTFKTIIQNLAKASGVNATEEFVTQVMQNTIQKLAIDPDQGVFEGSLTAAGQGAVGGTIAAGAITAGQAASNIGQQQAPTEEGSVFDESQQAQEVQEQVRGVEDTQTGADRGQLDVGGPGELRTDAGEPTDTGVEAQAEPADVQTQEVQVDDEDLSGLAPQPGETAIQEQPATTAQVIDTDAEGTVTRIRRGEGERSPEGTMSARRVDVDSRRSSLSLDEIPSPERKSFQQSLNNAKSKNLDREAVLKARQIEESPRALNDEETAGMALHMESLIELHKQTSDMVIRTDDPAELRVINGELARIEEEFDTVSKAVRLSGTEKGRALAAQKLTINNRFDLVSVLSRAKARKQKALAAGERAKLEKLTAELANADQRIAELVQRSKDANAETQFARRRQGRRRPRRQLETQRNELITRTNRLLRAGCRDR